MTYIPRFVIFVAMLLTLCLLPGCLQRPGGGEGRNLFDQSTPTPRREIQPRRVETAPHPVVQGMRQAGDPGNNNNNLRALQLFGTFFAIVLVLVGGFACWQIWKRKRLEWEMDDPQALVWELILAHQFSEQEKRLVMEIADKNELPTALKLFVEPKFLLEALKNDAFDAEQPAVRQLLSKLFDMSADGSDNFGADLESSPFSREDAPLSSNVS